MKAEDVFFINTVDRRACLNMYKKFGITNQQMSILIGLSTYLIIHKRRAVELAKYSSWSGAGPAMVRIIYSHAQGLFEMGALHQVGYNRIVGKFGSVALSAYGVRLLGAYYAEVQELIKKYKDRNKSFRFTDVGIMSDQLQTVLPEYVIKSVGRDD